MQRRAGVGRRVCRATWLLGVLRRRGSARDLSLLTPRKATRQQLLSVGQALAQPTAEDLAGMRSPDDGDHQRNQREAPRQHERHQRDPRPMVEAAEIAVGTDTDTWTVCRKHRDAGVYRAHKVDTKESQQQSSAWHRWQNERSDGRSYVRWHVRRQRDHRS